MGGSVKKLGGAVGGLVKGIGGGVNDTLFGKKVKGTRDRYMAMDKNQVNALGKYSNMLNQNTDRMAGIASQKQEWQARAGAADQSLLAGKMVAQRGLGRSSVGLNAIINPQKQVGENIAQIRANLPQLKQDMKFNNLERATNGIQNILGSRTFIQGTQGGRSGGLSGLIGAGIGGYMGGADGAKVGMQAGNALGKTGMGL